jgi:predicted ester cyclase
MGIEENKKTMQRYFDEIMNKDDFSNYHEIMDENFTGSLQGGINGIEARKQFAQYMRGLFPDGFNELTEMIAEGDKVVTVSTATGTFSGAGIEKHPAKGKEVEYNIIGVYTFKNGKIINGNIVADTFSLYQQLGAIPSTEEIQKNLLKKLEE